MGSAPPPLLLLGYLTLLIESRWVLVVVLCLCLRREVRSLAEGGLNTLFGLTNTGAPPLEAEVDVDGVAGRMDFNRAVGLL